MIRAFISIGSNINREDNIRSGVACLKRLGDKLQFSRVYESRAYGFEGDNFYNLVVGMETGLAPDMLTDRLREIEDMHERKRDVPKFSSRTLDLDLLLYGAMVRHDAGIHIPRRDIMKFPFVLKPLSEIAGDIRHPESGRLISEIWQSFDCTEEDIWPVEFDPRLPEDRAGGRSS